MNKRRESFFFFYMAIMAVVLMPYGAIAKRGKYDDAIAGAHKFFDMIWPEN